MNAFEKLLKESLEGNTFNDESIERLNACLAKGSESRMAYISAMGDACGIYNNSIRAEVRPGQKFARLVASQVHTQTGVEVNKRVFGFATHDGAVYSASNWNNPNKYKSQGSWEDLETLKGGEWVHKIK